MSELVYLVKDTPSSATKSFIIGEMKIPGPTFIPEIKSEEDIEVLLRYSKALNPHSPILVPASKWMKQIETPRFSNPVLSSNKIDIIQLVKDHPILFYEPPELFRYTMGKQLLSYSLSGNRSLSTKFKKGLKSGDESQSIELVPRFFRSFLERQMNVIYKDLEISPIAQREKDQLHVERGWLHPFVAESYSEHMTGVIVDALKMPTSAIIPPVPPLLKSSEYAYIQRTLSANKLTSLLCKELSDGLTKDLSSYFHLYLDYTLLQEGTGNDISTIIELLEDGLDDASYCGVALTFTSYEAVASHGKLRKVENLINEIVNISHSHHLPVILPRSGWYGLYHTDQDIQGFGGLLNGKEKYQHGGGVKDRDDIFGKTPLIDYGVELTHREVISFINQHGEFPRVEGLPRKPDIGFIDDPLRYRINFSKATRLIHAEEAKRIRDAKIKGVQNPAQRYFERTEHPHLSHP
jgi:hypothetical protein